MAQTRWLSLSTLACLLASVPAAAVVPTNGPPLTVTPIPVNVNSGEQYDPHVDGDLAVYSEVVVFDQVIHFYRFSTGEDLVIPRALPDGTLAQDFLSDVQGGRVVFNRSTPGGATVMLYEVANKTLTEINPVAGSIRYGTSVGGSTVAYADMSVVDRNNMIGEIFAWDLGTHQVTRLTNDLRYDDSPQVSPAGDLITWESCTTPFTDCDVMMARRGLAGWVVSPVAATALNEMDPHTDGTWVVWSASAGDANGWDIYWQQVGSTTIQRLELPDDQFHPSVAGGVIAFRTQDLLTLRSDLFLYDILTNRLYRVTSTPTIDETLSDLALLPTGELRMVWQANDDLSTTIPSNNIYGATFRVHRPPVARAGPDQNLYLGQVASLDGSASSDPNGELLAYAWTLDAAPPGSAAALVGPATVSPHFTPDVVGAYHLSLVVSDASESSAASAVVVNVSRNLPPIAVASGTPTSGAAPLTVSFDGSASSDPEHAPLTYGWDFGDPASGGANASTVVAPGHTYASPGSYTAVLTVTDDFGQADQASVAVTVTAPNLPPVVSPRATPRSGPAPLLVQFSANASDPNPADVLTYAWSFGDPASGGANASALADPTHLYGQAGAYPVTLSVSDGVNPPVTAALTISVDSSLRIHVREARVERGGKGKVEGKVGLKADFTFPGTLAPADVILVKFDGVTLLQAPFGAFRPESTAAYEFEAKDVEATIDFAAGTLKVSRHRMLTSGIDPSNGIDVEVRFGAATAVDHFEITGDHGRDDGDLSHKD